MSDEKPDFSFAFAAFLTALARALQADTRQVVRSRLDTELAKMLLPEVPISKADQKNLKQLVEAFRKALLVESQNR